MTVERSIGSDSIGDLTDVSELADRALESPVTRAATPVVLGEPGTWSLLLIPVAICVSLLVFGLIFDRF